MFTTYNNITTLSKGNTLTMKDEIWKEIKGYEGLYEVSNYGEVRNIKYGNTKSHHLHKNKYHRVSLSIKNKSKNIRVHRLVAIAFIPNPDNKPEVNHKDLNPSNNHVSNLEWVSGEDNIKHYLESDKYQQNLIKQLIKT